MTQRRRNRHRKRRVGRRAFLIGLGGSVSAALTYYLLRSIPAGNNAEPAPSPQAAPNLSLIHICHNEDGVAEEANVECGCKSPLTEVHSKSNGGRGQIGWK